RARLSEATVAQESSEDRPRDTAARLPRRLGPPRRLSEGGTRPRGEAQHARQEDRPRTQAGAEARPPVEGRVRFPPRLKKRPPPSIVSGRLFCFYGVRLESTDRS